MFWPCSPAYLGAKGPGRLHVVQGVPQVVVVVFLHTQGMHVAMVVSTAREVCTHVEAATAYSYGSIMLKTVSAHRVGMHMTAVISTAQAV
jgi:hypothetical protein